MKMIVVIVRNTESNNILRIAKDADPEAFISVASVMGVYGRGFEQLATVVKSKSKTKSKQ